jgi:voltage-gated sodium channel
MAKIDLESRFYNFCTRLNDNLNFQILSLSLIVFVAFVIGMSVVPSNDFYGEYSHIIKLMCSIYFLFEIIVRYFGHSVWDSRSIVGDKFSYAGIYIDAAIILLSFIPYAFLSNLLILRLFRLLSQPQITKMVPKIAITNFRTIQSAGVKILYVTAIIIILTYIYAIIGVLIFGETHPDQWGALGNSVLSLIAILLSNDTITYFLYPLIEIYTWSWIYILSYVFLGKLTILNLIIAILLDLLNSKNETNK